MHRRSWTEEEDRALSEYVHAHGPHHWETVAQAIGVRKSGNSCRLRWFNYLSPEVHRGSITDEEMHVILYRRYEWGNKWSQIAKELPGRTDNEIKNFWNTRVKKEAKKMGLPVESGEFLQQMVEKIQGHTMNAAAAHALTGTLPSSAAIGGSSVASSSFPFVTESPDFSGNSRLGDQAHAFTSTLPPPAAAVGGGVAAPSFSSLAEISDSNFWFEDHTSGYLDSFTDSGYGHHDFAYNPDEPPPSGMW